MKPIIIKIDNDTRQIIENLEVLKQLTIADDSLALALENNLLNYYVKAENQTLYYFKFIKSNNQASFYKVCKYPNNLRQRTNRKGKYSKIEIKHKNVIKIANDIGFVNAQMLHAKDYHTKQMISLRQFLKDNPTSFEPRYMYYKDYNDNYHKLRFKNLFSKHVDEVSDFERLALIARVSTKHLQISYELDEDILVYDDTQMTMQDRKAAREFAKDIYNKKGVYKVRELFDILESKDLYIQIINTVPKEHKSIWEQINYDQMNIQTLQKYRSEYYKSNTPQYKKRKYLSKRAKRRKQRSGENIDTRKRLLEYYEYY